MNRLAAANLMHHPGRTAATMAGVAVGVVLVLLTAGLVRGQLRDRGRRDTNLGVEILLSLRGQEGLSFTTLPLSLPVSLAARARAVPGVAGVTPVGQHLEMKGESGLGLRQLDGVNFPEYAALAGIRIIRGAPLPASGDFMVVDTRYAAAHGTKPGDRITALDREFTVTGVYEPETGARMMIPLETMQQALGLEAGNAGNCSMLLVKCVDPAAQEEVARRISAQHPDFRILFARDLPALFATGYQGFNVFLNAVAGLAMIISALVIMLTMYTAVTDRTRQIGILKAMGASRRFIILALTIEAMLITVAGLLCGLLTAWLAQTYLSRQGTPVSLEPDFAARAIAGALISGLAGTLYPALRAAALDPVTALSHE
ncbi:MAG: ABC transporter permease [Blastocatellia bacterium]